MARGRSFLLLLAVAALVGGYVWFVELKRDPAAVDEAPREKLFTTEASAMQEIRITNASGESLALRRSGDGWAFADAAHLEVDQTEAGSVATSLATLEANRVIDEAPASLAEYGLESPRVRVGFTAADGTSRTVLLGNKTVTAGDLYAKLEDSPRVLLIGSWLEETFNRSRFDLRDKAVVRFARDAVNAVALTSSEGSVTLTRRDGAWRITAPVEGDADATTVDSLINRLASARMTSIIDSPDLDAMGLARPAATVVITAGPTQARLEVGGAAPDGTVYARDVTRGLVFTVDASLADDLKKSADDFRPQTQGQ